MHIVTDIQLSQIGLERRRRRVAARMLCFGVVSVLVWLVFTSAADAIGAVAMAFIPLELVLYGSAHDRLVWLPVCLVSAVAVYVLIALTSSRKIPVLYSRRFGLRGTNRMITRAIEGGLGRQYRVLILDDSSFASLEIPRIVHLVLLSGVPFAVLLIVGIISVTGGQGLHLPQALVVAILYLFPLGYAAFLLYLPLLTLMAIAAVVLVYRWQIRRSFNVEIASVEQVSRCLVRVKRLSGWLRPPSVMAPQALAIRVVDKLWQEVVSQLAGQVHVLICDVSEPTNNLRWEVESMLARPKVRCVFVGDRAMVHAWAHANNDSNLEAPASRLKSLLQDQTILVFDPAQRLAQRRFNRNLRNSLENVSSTTQPASTYPVASGDHNP